MLHWHKHVPEQTRDVERNQGQMGSKPLCDERDMVREKGRRREWSCLNSAIRWGVLCGFISVRLCRLIKITPASISSVHRLPAIKGFSAAPTDEGMAKADRLPSLLAPGRGKQPIKVPVNVCAFLLDLGLGTITQSSGKELGPCAI